MATLENRVKATLGEQLFMLMGISAQLEQAQAQLAEIAANAEADKKVDEPAK